MRAPEKFPRFAAATFTGFASLLSLAFAPARLHAQREPRDAPPQLIQMGPKWRNVAELKRHAAEGDPAAAFELGERLALGDGVPQDHAAARTWFRRAADAGVADAWFRLGKLHHDGLGGPEDRALAFELFSTAAQLGVPEAQHNVGAMLVSGRGVKRDYVEGLAWLIVAGQSGAESSAEKQVRERLQRRPRDIARAEERAAELLAAVRQPGAEVKPRAAPAAEAAKSPAPPAFAPPRTPPPKLDVGAPKLEAPVPQITLPKPGQNE
jgi:hypothetical protein